MTASTVVFGYGATGRATVAALRARGETVRVAQRTRPAQLPAQAEFLPCDLLDPDAVHRAVGDARQAVLAVGFSYDRRVWRAAWPTAMRNMLEACATADARLVFIDNLYQIGPQEAPLREDMPLTDVGAKPAIRADVSRMVAAVADRVRVATLRCPDFYGPGVGLSHIGDTGFGRLARGKPAFLIAQPDTPHDFAYVPDVARAVLSLLDAADDAFGEVWNVPCAPTRTPREILALGAAAIGVAPRIRSVPLGLLPWLGVFVPFLREVADVSFTFDRPYRVDANKFSRRFWSDATPYEIGAPATAQAFRLAAA